MVLVCSSDGTGQQDGSNKHKKMFWPNWMRWRKSKMTISPKPVWRSHISVPNADLTVESHSSRQISLPDEEPQQDDVSSISGPSDGPLSRRTYVPPKGVDQTSVPSEIEFCVSSYRDRASSSDETKDLYEQETEDLEPVESVIKLSGKLDPTSTNGIVSEAASELDPEVKARVQAIRQLSLMMGADHPDVLFSMKYLGRLLHRWGDYAGASKIANHVQNLSCRD